jgi:hypothetical protein
VLAEQTEKGDDQAQPIRSAIVTARHPRRRPSRFGDVPSRSGRSLYVGSAMTDTDLPTARSTLAARYVHLLLVCRACSHQSHADLQRLIDEGRGDVPLVQLRFRCSQCGHGKVDALVMPSEDVLTPRADGRGG